MRSWKRKLDGAVVHTPMLTSQTIMVATLAGSLYTLDKVSLIISHV